MIPNKIDPKVSQSVVNSGSGDSSLKGYLNEQEFLDAVPKNYHKWAGLGFGIGLVLAIVESLSATYKGPFAPLVAAMFGVAVAYYKTMKSAQKFIDEGDEPK